MIDFGFLVTVCEIFLLIKLCKAGFQAESKKAIKGHYEGDLLEKYIADIIVESTVISELGEK